MINIKLSSNMVKMSLWSINRMPKKPSSNWWVKRSGKTNKTLLSYIYVDDSFGSSSPYHLSRSVTMYTQLAIGVNIKKWTVIDISCCFNKYCLGHTSVSQIRSTDWFNKNNDHQFVTCSLWTRSTLACSHPISAETISTDSNVIYMFLDCSSPSDYYHHINKNLIADDYSVWFNTKQTDEQLSDSLHYVWLEIDNPLQAVDCNVTSTLHISQPITVHFLINSFNYDSNIEKCLKGNRFKGNRLEENMMKGNKCRLKRTTWRKVGRKAVDWKGTSWKEIRSKETA